jgi:hypothetical protein
MLETYFLVRQGLVKWVYADQSHTWKVQIQDDVNRK